MYHIKQDKRAQASARLICRGLVQCLDTKSFEDISISDIQRASGVSRSTFYRNFDHIEDVLSLMCDGVFEEAFSSNYTNISEAVFNAWVSHSELMENIVKINRSDLLFSSLRRCAFKLRGILPVSADEALYDYFVNIIASSMAGIMITWIERGKCDSEDELKKIILQCVASMKFIGLG